MDVSGGADRGGNRVGAKPFRRRRGTEPQAVTDGQLQGESQQDLLGGSTKHEQNVCRRQGFGKARVRGGRDE
jgi:hypothetical protein